MSPNILIYITETGRESTKKQSVGTLNSFYAYILAQGEYFCNIKKMTKFKKLVPKWTIIFELDFYCIWYKFWYITLRYFYLRVFFIGKYYGTI